MSESDPVLLTLLCYYSREKYFQHVQDIAEDHLRNFVNDPVLQFFSAFAKLTQGQFQESLRIFKSLSDHPEMSLGAILGMIQAEKSARTVDKEAVQILENQLREERKSAGEKSNYYGALFLFLTEKYDRAREFVDKALKISPLDAKYLCLKGWNELNGSRDMKMGLKCFEDAIKELRVGEKYLDPWLGQSRYHELRQNYGGMIEALNQAAALNPNFLPIHLEKIKAQLMAREWEQCLETAQRCLIIDSQCLEAQKYMILHSLCYEGRYSESGRDLAVLQHTKTLCDYSMTLGSPADVQAELARQLRMLRQTKQAIRAYKEALDQQATSPEILLGIIHCHILDGNIPEAETQLEFLKAANDNLSQSVLLKYLESILAKRKNKPRNDLIHMFKGVVDQHFSQLQVFPFGPKYFIHLDPDFVLELVSELFDYVPREPVKVATAADPLLKEIQRILTILTEALPGLSEAVYLLGKGIIHKLRDTCTQVIVHSWFDDNRLSSVCVTGAVLVLRYFLLNATHVTVGQGARSRN